MTLPFEPLLLLQLTTHLTPLESAVTKKGEGGRAPRSQPLTSRANGRVPILAGLSLATVGLSFFFFSCTMTLPFELLLFLQLTTHLTPLESVVTKKGGRGPARLRSQPPPSHRERDFLLEWRGDLNGDHQATG